MENSSVNISGNGPMGGCETRILGIMVPVVAAILTLVLWRKQRH